MEAPYMLKAMQEVWELLCTTIMWFIWIVRCSKVFGNTIVHPVESVRNVWMQMVHTLKGRYDEIKGETNVAVLQRLEFIAYWKKAPFLKCKTHVVLSTTNMVVPTTNHITRLWNGDTIYPLWMETQGRVQHSCNNCL